jgi:hypothetical protein
MGIDLSKPSADLGIRLIIEASTDPAERQRVACTAADARLALAWLTGQQYAHTGIRDHPDQYFRGQPRWTRKETP